MDKDEAPIRSIQEVILDLQKKKSLETDVVDTEVENVNNDKTFLEDAKDFVAPIIDFLKINLKILQKMNLLVLQLMRLCAN